MRIGVLCSRIRVEEKLLLQEIERRGLDMCGSTTMMLSSI